MTTMNIVMSMRLDEIEVGAVIGPEAESDITRKTFTTATMRTRESEFGDPNIDDRLNELSYTKFWIDDCGNIEGQS